MRESPALDVIGLLMKKGAIVSYHDPYVAVVQHDTWNLTSVPDLMNAMTEADCVVIVTNHKVYDYQAVLEKSKLIVDTRNALGSRGLNHPKVTRL